MAEPKEKLSDYVNRVMGSKASVPGRKHYDEYREQAKKRHK